MREKPTLTFEIHEYRQHGYDFTEIKIRTLLRQDTKVERDECVDNKAGYGDATAAQRMHGVFQSLLDQGYEEHYDCTYWNSLQVTLTYQHYYPENRQPGDAQQYCSPRIDLGDEYGRIKLGMAFLDKLGKAVERERVREATETHYTPSLRKVSSHSFENPMRVLGALGRMKGSVQVKLLSSHSRWVPTDGKIVGAAA